MNHKITIETPVLTSDGAGGTIETWGTSFSTWASIKTISTKNILEDNQVALKNAYKIYVRWYKDRVITIKDRVKLKDGILFSITGVQKVDFEKKYIEIRAVQNN